MLRPLTVGLRYTHQDQWIGGLYYVQNLVRALGLLPKGRRPRLVIVGGDKAALEDLRGATGYPDLRRVSRTRIQRAPARPGDLFRSLMKPSDDEIDLILLGAPPGLEDRGMLWIADFQEERFPEWFPPEELAARRRRNAEMLAVHRHVMVSSQDVARDLERFHGRAGADVHVVRFASFADRELAGVDAAAVRRRHGLPERYFICSNQLWKHKNHRLVLEALALAPDAPPVVFTGKEDDHRDPAYAPSIRALAESLGLGDRARFLGFLPRADQLALMVGAAAVIQPSLCEGWSTTIEDAKALGRAVLASDIAVHREQIGVNVDFFPPDDARALADLLSRYARMGPNVQSTDYTAVRRRFADDLMRMIVEVERDFRRRKVERLLITP